LYDALKAKVTRSLTQLKNKCVFSTRRNCQREMVGWRSSAGRLWYRRGPATANDRSPRRVRVRSMTHVRASDDCSWRRRAAVMSWQSSARYRGARPCWSDVVREK